MTLRDQIAKELDAVYLKTKTIADALGSIMDLLPKEKCCTIGRWHSSPDCTGAINGEHCQTEKCPCKCHLPLTETRVVEPQKTRIVSCERHKRAAEDRAYRLNNPEPSNMNLIKGTPWTVFVSDLKCDFCREEPKCWCCGATKDKQKWYCVADHEVEEPKPECEWCKHCGGIGTPDLCPMKPKEPEKCDTLPGCGLSKSQCLCHNVDFILSNWKGDETETFRAIESLNRKAKKAKAEDREFRREVIDILQAVVYDKHPQLKNDVDSLRSKFL